MNIFEGSRRIAKVLAAIWVAGFTIGAFFVGSYDPWGEIRTLAFVMVGGLLVIAVFTKAMGWIVRGFLGIPKGQDSKS